MVVCRDNHQSSSFSSPKHICSSSKVKVHKSALIVFQLISSPSRRLDSSQIYLFNKSVLLRLMGSKTSLILLKFLQSINMKKTI
jgi:hypothetical protein